VPSMRCGDSFGLRAGAVIFPFHREKFRAEVRGHSPIRREHNTNRAAQPAARRWDCMRPPHGWKLIQFPGFLDTWITEFVRPAIDAMTRSMAAHLGRCRFALLPKEPARTSQWTNAASGLQVTAAPCGFRRRKSLIPI
jgi:hypothetical protein